MTEHPSPPSKSILRSRAIAARRRLSEEERLFSTIAATERVLPLLLALPGTIGLYQAMRDELDAGPLIARLAEAGRRLALPCIVNRREPMRFRLWAPGEALVAGPMAIPQPPDSADEVRPEALVVPLVAFDERCYRLGYGAGFYDRAIPALRPVVTIGFAFSVQEVERVPDEPFDVPLDLVVTDEAVFGRNA